MATNLGALRIRPRGRARLHPNQLIPDIALTALLDRQRMNPKWESRATQLPNSRILPQLYTFVMTQNQAKMTA